MQLRVLLTTPVLPAMELPQPHVLLPRVLKVSILLSTEPDVLNVLLLVVVVPNFLLVQQQQIERVQLALQDQHGKIQHHIHLLRVNLVRHVLMVPQ